MPDQPKWEIFGGSEALLRFIQERSEDIEKVVICPPGYSLSYMGKQMSQPFPHFTMMLFFLSGERKIMHGDDAELLLNNGILSRMKIKIELAKGEAG